MANLVTLCKKCHSRIEKKDRDSGVRNKYDILRPNNPNKVQKNNIDPLISKYFAEQGRKGGKASWKKRERQILEEMKSKVENQSK